MNSTDLAGFVIGMTTIVVLVLFIFFLVFAEDLHSWRHSKRAQKMAHRERMAEIKAREAEALKQQKYQPLWTWSSGMKPPEED